MLTKEDKVESVTLSSGDEGDEETNSGFSLLSSTSSTSPKAPGVLPAASVTSQQSPFSEGSFTYDNDETQDSSNTDFPVLNTSPYCSPKVPVASSFAHLHPSQLFSCDDEEEKDMDNLLSQLRSQSTILNGPISVPSVVSPSGSSLRVSPEEGTLKTIQNKLTLRTRNFELKR